MSYIALYRKWRPLVFEDVVEQEHVVRTLRYSVGTGRIAHAYLFCGTRGTGKTSMAHILSRAINCLNPNNGDPCNQCEICREILSGSSMDVLEIDAASNNSVDNVREIRDEVIYAPSRAKFKVYIIDEVHMLSTGAFNALLKTLEEPPAHVVFILATTEPHKLPATILSRCQRFDFRRISIDSIVKRLDEITAANNISLDKDAARLIAKLSDGALRDAISLLDQCISLGNTAISYNDVLSVIGIVNDTFIASLADDMANRDVSSLLNKVDRLVMDGKDIAHFISDLTIYYRNLLICKVTSNPGDVIEVPGDVLEVMKTQCGRYSQDEIIYIIKELSALEAGLRWATNPRIMLEVTLVKLCENNSGPVNESILERLALLEKKVNSGNISIKPTSPTATAAAVEVRKPPAVVKPDTAAPTPVPKGKYLDIWPDVLKHIRNSGRMAVYSFLLDTKAVRLNDNFIGILFNAKNRFGKTAITKVENLEVVEEAVSKLMSREMKVQCLDEDSTDNSPAIVLDGEKDELVEKTRSLAETAGIPFEVIDE